MSLIPRDLFRQDDFFAPFFSGWPFDTGALMAPTGTTQQVATRSMPVDVVEVSAMSAMPRERPAVVGPRLLVPSLGVPALASSCHAAANEDAGQRDGLAGTWQSMI